MVKAVRSCHCQRRRLDSDSTEKRSFNYFCCSLRICDFYNFAQELRLYLELESGKIDFGHVTMPTISP